MCLIGVAWRAHARYELVLAANRDEFHARPSAAAAPWKDHPTVFGGRDLKVGGSWLAASTSGRVAAVTNVRRMVPPDPSAPSRGKLVADFLTGMVDTVNYAEALREDAENYSGFNLLVGDGKDLLFVTNHPEFRIAALGPGIHTVSNASLDTPWPKSRRLHAALESWSGDNWESFGPLFKALGDRTPAREGELPNTALSKSMEKLLSSPFIVSPEYGTRCSTVVAASAKRIEFAERRFDPSGDEMGRTEKTLSLTPNP